jgi:hypothetical protein
MTTTMRSGIRIVAAMAVAAVISMSAGSAGAQVAGSTTIGENRQARNLGTFNTREEAERHERAVQFFKRRGK